MAEPDPLFTLATGAVGGSIAGGIVSALVSAWLNGRASRRNREIDHQIAQLEATRRYIWALFQHLLDRADGDSEAKPPSMENLSWELMGDADLLAELMEAQAELMSIEPGDGLPADSFREYLSIFGIAADMVDEQRPRILDGRVDAIPDDIVHELTGLPALERDSDRIAEAMKRWKKPPTLPGVTPECAKRRRRRRRE